MRVCSPPGDLQSKTTVGTACIQRGRGDDGFSYSTARKVYPGLGHLAIWEGASLQTKSSKAESGWKFALKSQSLQFCPAFLYPCMQPACLK